MTNPLKQFFRQPAIYIKLPSGGNYYGQDALDMPANKELPVYPMTAIDEITYRTPDALFNGQAIVSVIQSCVPNIKDAWEIPATDIDAILTAIRIASYGHSLEIDTVCPSCQEEANFGLDLRSVIDKLRSPDYGQTIGHGDMTIRFKPMNYRQINENNSMQFEEQKILSMLPDASIPEEEKRQRLQDALKKITEVTIHALAKSIESIKTSTALVNETEYITEFLEQCDRQVFNQIREHVVNLKQTSELQPLDITCPSCRHQYKQAFTLDMSNFFE